jgi:4'-phosphopantetheinyl transferase
MTLFPVVMPVIEFEHKPRGKEKVDYLSQIARKALKLSAERSGVTLGKLLKDENGVPCPVNGNYWSLSHKPEYVAAVVSKDKVGIDIEELRPRDELLFARVASDKEWELKGKSWDILYRYWTAKEAILKVIGTGISGLKTCRIISVPDENHVVLDYSGQFFLVEQLQYKNHIVSVLKDDNQIDWIIAEDFNPSFCSSNKCRRPIQSARSLSISDVI